MMSPNGQHQQRTCSQAFSEETSWGVGMICQFTTHKTITSDNRWMGMGIRNSWHFSLECFGFTLSWRDSENQLYFNLSPRLIYFYAVRPFGKLWKVTSRGENNICIEIEKSSRKYIFATEKKQIELWKVGGKSWTLTVCPRVYKINTCEHIFLHCFSSIQKWWVLRSYPVPF